MYFFPPKDKENTHRDNLANSGEIEIDENIKDMLKCKKTQHERSFDVGFFSPRFSLPEGLG